MPTPYYADDTVTLYHGDATEMLGDFTADRAITDPPYGFGAYETDREASPDVLRWLLKSKTAAIFGYPEILVRWCIELSRAPDEWVTWWSTANKSRAYGSALARESEHVAVFGEIHGERILRPRSKDAWTRGISRSRGLDPDWCRDGDVWRDAAEGVAFNGHLRQHPNQKPLGLMRRLVELCSNLGDTVVDPYAGSGTTLRAAKDLGRRAIGVEIDERYCEIAARRLSQEVLDFGEAV